MKKIINGRTYDTTTATAVGNWTSSHAVNDSNYFRETLYRKRTGEFFIHGAGNGLSPYAGHYPDGSGWGERISPLSYEQAKVWAEDRLDAEDYERIFGAVTEGEEALYVPDVPSAIMDRIRRKAQQNSATIKDTVIAALEHAVQQNKETTPMTIDTNAIRNALADFVSDRYDIYNAESAAANKDYYGIFTDALDAINDKLGTSYSIPDVSEWISSIDADLNEDDIPGNYAEVSDHYRDQWVGQSMGIESTIREALDAIDGTSAMMYIVINQRTTEPMDEGHVYFDTLDEANAAAETAWDYLTQSERKTRRVWVMHGPAVRTESGWELPEDGLNDFRLAGAYYDADSDK